MLPTKSEYDGWLQHPVTQAFRQYLRDLRMSAMEDWANGALLTPKVETAAIMNTEAAAKCSAYGEIANLAWEEMVELYKQEGENEERERDSSRGTEGADPA